MPIGPFGEILGTTGTLEYVTEAAQKNYKTKVIAPRNPKLVKGETAPIKLRPSQYMFQMSMDTEKKLANMHTMHIPRKIELLDMSEQSHQKMSTVNIDEPMFQPFPSEVIFQNYEPFEVYEVPLTLRNNDKVPRLVKVTQEDSPYFKIISPNNVGHKVGPGLPTTFTVQFTPEERKDYDHELVCTTERERFVVPVRAIGARAILDFPDDVHFQPGPVKYSSSRTLLVRNIGTKEAYFTLATEKPFFVTPENGVVPVNDCIQITIDFRPTSVGDHEKELLVHYDTGEDVFLRLYGAAMDSNVRLDKNSIRIENTFISMANHRTVTIANRSDVIAHFRWTQFATAEEENLQKMMLSGKLENEKKSEEDRFLEECLVDPTLRDKMSIMSRTFQNRLRQIGNDQMIFSDEVFKIDPLEGDIWPNSTAEISVIFKPREPQSYNRTVFCDITGRQSRLPLRMRGDGIGPSVQFSFDEMDIGNIFVNSAHTYEVVLANKGDIDAIFSLVPNSSVFGPCFQFNPSEGIVMPDGHQAIQIMFSSNVLGDFEEEFCFQIDGSPQNLKLIFKGSVIGPTFHFDVPKLKFGNISYGFVHSEVCTLQNTALVPMTYHLRVPGDGVGESICSTSEYDSNISEAGSTQPPKEFDITPNSGTLQPQSHAEIKVDICSNTLKKYELSLVVDIQGVGDEVLTVPISAKCVVPQVTVVTPLLDYGRCFLRHPYEHHVRLQNDSDLPAKYELVPQQIDQFTSIIYSSPQPKGILEPNSILEVPLVITPQGLEELEITAFFSIFGSPDPPLPVHVSCIGEGPVVHIMPMSMDWGQIPVLADQPKILRLSNESLIPAKFTAHMVRPHSMWHVEPDAGEIAPEDQMDLTVTACADDCVRFQDKVQINFLDGPSRSIPVSAYGHGTTLVTDPPMSPVLNLGPHFSKGPCIRTFTLTNRGRRHQSLVWNTEGFGFTKRPKKHGSLQPLNHKDMKYKDNPPPLETPHPVFKLTPHRMELNPGESMDVVLEGCVEDPQIVQERMLCHAIIGRAGGKELIMKVQVNCEFISPLLQFSESRLYFRVDKSPEDVLCIQQKQMDVTNISSLPLSCQLTLNYPFTMLADGETLNEMDLYLGIGENRTLVIQFDPLYKEDSHIRILDDVLTVHYKEHPHVDTVDLCGEVYFPNVEFEKEVIDFGCILNDTEVTRYVNMTNNSPMEVRYKWSFLLDDEPTVIFRKPTPPPIEDADIMEIQDAQEVSPRAESHGDDGEEDEEEEELQERAESGIEKPDSPEGDVTVHVEPATATPTAVPSTVVPAPSSSGPQQSESQSPVKEVTTPKTQSEMQRLESQGGLETGDEEEEVESPGPREASGPPSRAESRQSTPRSPPPINPVLAALLQEEEQEELDLGVEEVFDILPLYGSLKPGETEQMTLTFYGHAHIGGKAKAICEIEGGPTYEITLKGEASLVQYRFDCMDIDYGKIMYDQVGVAEITLINTGRVGFEFVAVGMDPGMAVKPKPGIPVMIPHAGFIEASSQQTLTIKFLPGVPLKFHKSFEIQVAHFEPDTVNLLGEGVFPRISLDLPRQVDESFESMVKEVKEQLTTETKKSIRTRPMSAVSQQGEEHNVVLQEQAPSDLEIQLEVERRVVQEFTEEMLEQNNSPDVLAVHGGGGTAGTGVPSTSSSKKRKKANKQRARLPPYILDFGHVVLGTVCTHIVRATNTGWFPVSFSVDRDYLYQYGFNVELDRVRQLPGAPDHETVDFRVTFDPRGANLGLGPVHTFVPINIVSGPQVLIQLCANVTMPDMQISTDVLDFSEVRCGEAKVVTVQLYNHQHVPCEWNSLPTEKDRQKIDKHVPMHLRRKLMRQEKVKPRSFEMMPPYGSLSPGQRQNVQVKFMPVDEKFYEHRMAIRLAQSSQRIMLLCRGQGLEPTIEFEKNLVEFGPILPHSAGDEQEIVMRNPCKFPIEVYNLEFDKGYLEEEKILRLMKGYDEYNTILLPPRNPTEKLPQELLEYYEEQMRKLEEMEAARRAAEEAAEAAAAEAQAQEEAQSEMDKDDRASKQGTESQQETRDGQKTDRSDATRDDKNTENAQKDSEENPDNQKEKDSSSTVGELEITPVSQAIARHLGIDLSPEGKAARNRRGIAVIVHGAPLSGKSTLAVNLAKQYEAALLTVDAIILEAISNGNTEAGRKARQLCSETAHKRAEEQRALEGEMEAVPTEKKASTGAGALSVEAVAAHTQGTGLTIGQVTTAHSVAQSLVSNRKTSTISDQKSKEKHHGSTVGGKTAVAASSNEINSQVPSSPPPLAAPIARRLSVSASVAGEEGLVSCVLPDELLTEILADRLLLNDCHRGVVVDGLDTLFSQNHCTTANAILKALNNRKYLYFVTLKLDYNVMKEQEKKRQEEKERVEREEEEQERRLLEEMSEDEYDALDEEGKASVDRKRLSIKKERLRREMEEKKVQRELQEKAEAEAELLRQEMEKANKKKKGKGDSKDAKDKKGGKVGDGKSTDRVTALKSQEGKKGHDSDHAVTKSSSGDQRPESHMTDRDNSAEEGKKKKGKDGGKDGKRPISNEAGERKGKGDKNAPAPELDLEEQQKEPKSEAELLLMQRFRTFEHSMKELEGLVDHWERSTGMIRPGTPSDGGHDIADDIHVHPPSGRKAKKSDKHDKAADKKGDKGSDKSKDTTLQAPSGECQDDGQSEPPPPLTEEERKEKRLEEGIGIPNIIVDCANKDSEKPIAEMVFDVGRLPSVEEVLDGLGLGPKGPPIPPPALFGVIPYPIKRHAPPGADNGHYIFVASSADDPNVATSEDKAKEEEADDDKSVSVEGRKEDHTPSKKGKAKGENKLQADTKKSSRQSSAKSRTGRRSSTNTSSPPPGQGAPTPASETDGSTADTALQDPKTPKLNQFRWLIPAEGEVILRLRFVSEDLGQFDQTLNFEIMGTRRRYQLYCRGICAFPSISREPRIVFPHRKKSKKADEIVQKKYILTSETFEFGPLLVGKSRDRYKDGKYPENMEKLTVQNTSPMDADISFCFLTDSKAETYLLDPPAMQLTPGQSQELTIWAYPKVPGTYEDALVCCVKENPEPIMFKIISYGVRPELELDKKTLQFEKVLLHRKDTKTLYLRNSTLLPVAWRLNGLENLGDDFSVSQESGVIEPKSEFALNAYFRAMKPVNTNRKAVRLEVSDVDNIMGLVQTENIQVHAEAYDVALDMSFPKGADGGIDFDVIRVSDKHIQTCSLKNKGKYDIRYQFIFEPNDQCPQEVCDMFSISAPKGSLSPTDKANQVTVTFQSDKEVTVKDQPILRAQVIEPSLGDEGETIASIPIKLSVKSVFSKYNIYPVNDINFASMVVGHKKTRIFVIENKGDRFEFKYTITKMLKEMTRQEDRKTRPQAVRGGDGSSSGRSGARPRRTESNSEWEAPNTQQSSNKLTEADKAKRKTARPDAGGVVPSRLILGMYNIYPAVGTIFPGGHQQITVECLAESPGHYEEEIAIDITGRDPNDHPQGIPYKLISEACIPGIDIANIGSIFEEHNVCKNLSVWQHSHHMESGGVYGEDENRFVFNNVLVGSKSKARYKICNNNKVPCVVQFSVKPVFSKHAVKHQDVFEVEPSKSEISARGFIYATVSFAPPSMQHFSAVFEAAVETSSQNAVKGRSLVFEVVGEGNLPRITILKPTVRNKRGQPLLLFKRNLIGQKQILPMHIINDGSLPSKVDIDLIDPDGAFSLVPTGTTQAVVTHIDDAKRRPHTASVIINVGESATFDATFEPRLAQRSQGSIHMSVVNNQYEDSIVQLVGEGYEDEISLDNIHSIISHVDPENEEGCMADDDIPAAKNNHIKFGDCYVNEPRTLSFSMTNHSKTDCIRFEWPEHPQLKFSPMVGHIHSGRMKDMTISFCSDTPQTLDCQAIPCKLTKITFDKPPQEVADWDDRVKTVKWVDVPPPQPNPAPSVDGSQKDKPITPLPPPTGRPVKKKVVETEPEPPHTSMGDSTRSIDLLVSGLADYTKVKCKVETVHFKDTLMLQTRVFEFQLSNKGNVTMEYSWQVVLDAFPGAHQDPSTTSTQPETQRPPTAASLVVPPSKNRPESATTSISSDASYVPFFVEPETGKILPGKKATVVVKFSPLDVNEFEGRLICSVPNLDEGKQGPVIGIKGRSLLPYCHFELEDSDYLRSARRNPELRGPKGAPPGTTLDPNTRVVEFSTVGIGVKQSRHFHIVNPTSSTYSFYWVNEDEAHPKKEDHFKCLVPEGKIKSGKKTQVGFEFTSSMLDLGESFWTFVIPEQNISVPFLLVGTTNEPNITLERSHLNFKSLLIGHEAEEVVHLTNSEDVPFYFAFEEASLYAAGYSACLQVEPAVGSVPAKSTIPVYIRFTPVSEKEVNFNVTCKVKKKTTPLSLNVKAEGYTMNCLVLCEESGGVKQELSASEPNEIKFGEVEVNEKNVKNISVVNCGKFNFDYSWELEERSAGGDHMVSITPLSGGVMHGERKVCQLSFCPSRATSLRGCRLLLKISNGPVYVLHVFGTGVIPGLHFSYTSYNFGPCFVHRAGMPLNTSVLKVTNTDRKEISLDCRYQSNSHLHHNFEAQVIPSSQSVDVTFTFYPREAKKYRESVEFEVNGLSQRCVEFTGLGTEMKVEVADPKQKMLKLGALRLNQTLKRIVPIINRSPAPIEFQLGITPSSPALQENNVLKISPTQKIQLGPNGGQAKVEVVFSPKTRIPQFTEEVLLECAGLYQPLFVIQGSCQGIEISIDSEAIPFGAVVKKSSSDRNVIMSNTGDIGARFRWDTKKFAPDFSISPIEGYISPGMDIPFEIIFHPQEINNDIRYENLKCAIEGGKPLKLTLTGTCVEIPPSRDAAHFTTHVRHKETKNIIVQNRCNVACTVRPIIDGEYFSGADTFAMDPSSNKPYEVTYKPLTMTVDNKKHQGTVFFPFPDGTGQMFSLTGTSEAPKAASKINRDIPCKTSYSEMLSVQNWLKKPQRFRVKIEMVRPDRLDPGTTVKGLDYIDVPGNSRRDYKLTFYAHKEGQSQIKVVFLNEQTQEYQFYEVTFRAVRPGVISTIELSTPVRQSVPHTITLENPLPYQVTFGVTCSIPEIQMPSQLHVSGQNEGQFNFEYLPLKVGEFQGRIELTCNDLGLYTYDLVLKATPAGPERALYFRTCLGTNQIQTAKFLNFAKQKTDYSCKVDNSDFHVDKTIVAAPGSSSGTEVALDVTYEPSHIGQSRGMLTVTSSLGGEYTFPLFGTCIPPKPQGPFTIRSGSNTSITFRNVFAHTTAFVFQVDNPLFHVTKAGENIKAHKDHRIVVGFDGNDTGSKASVMGKLIVSCAKSAGGATSAQWVYYLKGFTPEK